MTATAYQSTDKTRRHNAEVLAQWENERRYNWGDNARWNYRRLQAVVEVEAKGNEAQVAVCGNKTVAVGDTVKHYAQRWTGCATGRVVGFEIIAGGEWGTPNVRVLIEELDLRGEPTGRTDPMYGMSWDWDRTQTASVIR